MGKIVFHTHTQVESDEGPPRGVREKYVTLYLNFFSTINDKHTGPFPFEFNSSIHMKIQSLL